MENQAGRRKRLSTYLVMGVVGALITGLAIGAQSTLSSRVGSLIGSFRTGVLTNAIGGAIAGLILVVLVILNGKEYIKIPAVATVLLVTAGALGIMIITGVAFSLQRAGVAAGLATIILGQMVISLVADARGWGGAEPIPVTLPRIIGLVIIAAGVYLLLPKR
jgi:transporter family-2 protein